MKQGFNLLKSQIEPPSMWTKVYDWVVGTARLIVIIVEIIVVVAFVIRLMIDVRSTELDKEIESKESQASYFKQNGGLDSIIRTQIKAKGFEYAWTESQVFSEIYMNINRYIPDNFVEGSVIVDGERITIVGKATVYEIGRLEENMKNSTIFRSVELKNIETQGSSSEELAEFSISAKVNNIELRTIH